MRVLITGAGSLGCHVARIFALDNHDVLLFDKMPDKVFAKSIIGSKYLSIVQGNVNNLDNLIDVCMKFRPNCIIHTAGLSRKERLR